MTRTEIIDAAFRVWGLNFYRKTSLSQLAGELKVSKPALYRHFRNKQALTDAMTERFLDDFASSIRTDFESAVSEKDADKGISTIIESISGFFARNVYALVFSITNIYDRNLDGQTIVKKLKLRNVDMAALKLVMERKYTDDPKVVRMVFTTLTFLMSNFHKINCSMLNPPTDDKIQKITAEISDTIKNGLKFPAKNAVIDFEEKEKQVEKMPLNTQAEPFFKAIAEAVAEAGPWDVSMEMVAKRLGLSKSSLYGHFKNKKDMLRRLFATEFKRIIEFAQSGIKLSNDPAEQLYLGIFSIAVYLRSRPEILVAMDWIRTRKLELGKPDKHMEIFRLFEDVDIESMRNSTEEDRQRFSHWILFLLINVLTYPNRNNPMASIRTSGTYSTLEVQNSDIRMLFKFITLGLGGFL